MSPTRDGPDDAVAALHKLSLEEERLWKQTKDEPNTYEDWADLNASIVAYRRRRIERHAMKAAGHVPRKSE